MEIKKSSIFDSLEERYAVKDTSWFIDLVSAVAVAAIVIGLAALVVKQYNLF